MLPAYAGIQHWKIIVTVKRKKYFIIANLLSLYTCWFNNIKCLGANHFIQFSVLYG